MTSVEQVTNEESAEPTGVNRLEPWMARNPHLVAGFWVFFALASAVSTVLADGDEPLLALKLVTALGATVLFAREVRRHRARQ